MTRRWARALVSAAGLLATLLAVPWGLVVLVGWPLPRHVPDPVELQAWLVRQPTLPTIIDTGACLLWLVWGWCVHAVAVAAVARIRHRRATPTARRRLRLATPLHAVASSAVGSLVLTTATAAPALAVLAADNAAPVGHTGAAGSGTVLDEPPPGPDQAARVDGVAVPGGGWLPHAAAAMVSGLGARVWVARRVRYQPRHLADPAGDVDLLPLPAAVSAVRHAVSGTTAPHEGGAPPWDVTVEAATPAAGVTVGVRDGVPLTPADLPAAGVGLVGPGATDAARALITMSLLASPAVTVHTTTEDVEVLFGPDAGPLARRCGLVAHPNLGSALAELERHARRPPGGGLLLVAEAPDPAVAGRLDTLLGTAGLLRVALVGACPGRELWHVRRRGLVRTGTDPAAEGLRLGVLDVPAAVDVLTALAELAADPTATAVPSPRAPSTPVVDLAGPARARLRLLGPPRLTDDEGRPVRIRRSAGWQILLYLAVHPDGATADELKEALWPDVASSLAAGRFNTTMSELRQSLHTAVVIGQQPDPQGRIRYRLDPAHIEIDLWNMDDAVTRAATAIDPAGTATALHDVIDAYRGELAEGCRWEWIQPRREAVLRRVVDAYAHLAGTETDHLAALDLLQQAIRIAPYTEALYQLAMRRHAAAGHIDAVRHTLQTLADQLRTVGREPSEQTRRLAANLPHTAGA